MLVPDPRASRRLIVWREPLVPISVPHGGGRFVLAASACKRVIASVQAVRMSGARAVMTTVCSEWAA